MQSPILTADRLSQSYTAAIDALCTIARTYFFEQGKTAKALHFLHTAQQLLEGDEVKPQDRCKFLLQYASILATAHHQTHEDAALLFSTIREANQLAETLNDQQQRADVLSVLGQAHYTTTLSARIDSGKSPNCSQAEGDYAEALTHQQQALELREALHDTRGMSESHFLIGLVHERWGQSEQAREHYRQAIQLAEQYGHLYERTEPTRHLAWYAFLGKKDLDEALAYAQQALALREAANFQPYLPFDHLLLSDIYKAKGETAKALLHAQKAVLLAEETGSQSFIAFTSERLEGLNKL
ncbi:tetratricopeptide repeat protein [Ktedonosporobacter rubrisoli]|nr:tetratricopeptide repeat protein [Ktedonosporobacter rubrisoli]